MRRSSNKGPDPIKLRLERFQAMVEAKMADGFDPADFPTYRCKRCHDRRWYIRSVRQNADGDDVEAVAPCPDCNREQFERYKDGAYLPDSDPRRQAFLQRQNNIEEEHSRGSWRRGD